MQADNLFSGTQLRKASFFNAGEKGGSEMELC